MSRKQVVTTINLAHFFKSAFTAEQVYRFLPIKLDRPAFDGIVGDLKSDGLLTEKSGVLFYHGAEESYDQKRQWSRDLFRSHRLYLRVLAKSPWVKYVALTGANAFESCQQADDIDLFVVSKKNRLWLCYVGMVIISHLFRKRATLCINYIVDENNLHIPQHDYYTAIQLMQMVPIFDNGFGKKMIEQNKWVFDFLPNAAPELPGDEFYRVRSKLPQVNGSVEHIPAISHLNRFVYKKYVTRLSRKYPEEFGKGIIIGEGRAKLHRNDHHNIYDDLIEEVDPSMPV